MRSSRKKQVHCTKCYFITDILPNLGWSYQSCGGCGRELRKNTDFDWKTYDEEIEELEWFDDLFNLTGQITDLQASEIQKG